MYFYVDKRTQQVSMISEEKIEQTAFDEFRIDKSNPVYLDYLIKGGSIYVKNGILILE